MKFGNAPGGGGNGGSAGVVLQRVVTTRTDTATITSTMSTTPTNTSGTEVLSRTITPANAANLVRLQIQISGSSNNTDDGPSNKYFLLTVLRGTTVIAVFGLQRQAFSTETDVFQFTDAPNSTAQQTYSVRLARNATSSGNFLLNQLWNATTPTPAMASSLEAMEIAG
ncbi:hypothetical protein [Planctopirus hydrillae]|uniref:Uncharacterized protein n=1 Tax=Planctopirus hydrillae TaxID=1841610 RepID=A0A1C3E4B1_9PLAN|nr:hypothetical protein [Planctopirus hydrillae]ODA28070.1 hypothetical protein A6X21_14510 [Planctopirus hydrillae]